MLLNIKAVLIVNISQDTEKISIAIKKRGEIMKTLCIIAIVFLTCLAFIWFIHPKSATAQQRSYRIYGYITYESGDCTSAQISCYDHGQDETYYTCMNENRYYQFTGLSAGEYDVRIEKAIRWPTGYQINYSGWKYIEITTADVVQNLDASGYTGNNCSYPPGLCTGCRDYSSK